MYLRDLLLAILSDHAGYPVAVARVRRKPCAYRSSFQLEELDVVLRDGGQVHLVLKDASREGLLDHSIGAKPGLVFQPSREFEAYRSILAPSQVSSPKFFGAAPRDGGYWLLLERVAGKELYQVGDLAVWQEVARWLAAMHGQFQSQISWLEEEHYLLRYQEFLYRAWFEKALRGKAGAVVLSLAREYERAVQVLTELPRTFLHGDFYPSNILIGETPDGVSVRPVDWEMAGLGPGVIDLAALIAGHWSEVEKGRMAAAYYERLVESGSAAPSAEQFSLALDSARLFLAVQWLGWSPKWSPPRQHAYDWRTEAQRQAEKLMRTGVAR